MAKNAPRSRNIELREKLKQPFYDFLALNLACSAESFSAEQVARPPDQLEIDADGEDAVFQIH